MQNKENNLAIAKYGEQVPFRCRPDELQNLGCDLQVQFTDQQEKYFKY